MDWNCLEVVYEQKSISAVYENRTSRRRLPRLRLVKNVVCFEFTEFTCVIPAELQ